MNRITLLPIIVVLGLSTIGAYSQDPSIQSRYKVPLTLTTDSQQKGSGAVVQFEAAEETRDGRHFRKGVAPGGIPVEMELVSDTEVKITVPPGPHNSKLQDIAVKVDKPAHLLITRQMNGRSVNLPYSIIYHKTHLKAPRPSEFFYWHPEYEASGVLRIGECERKIAVFDFNGDGKFDSRDDNATNLLIDENGDGRFYGADEYFMKSQIIEVCGHSLVVEQMDPDGGSITFADTSERIPKVGEPLPAVSMRTTTGETLTIGDPRKNALVLDFWASWCLPCIAKFPLLKELERKFPGSFEVIAINVDDAGRVARGTEVAKAQALTWPQVMSGKGEEDSVWKLFGSMAHNKLGIPLYVVVDPSGLIVYAGSGGDDLSDLELHLRVLSQKK